MDNKELLRRLALLKANPKLAETIPQAEVFKMIQDVISAFNVLKTAIDNGKIKGEPGYTPIPDVDYPSLTRYDKSIEETITALETNYSYALDAIEKKLATVKDGIDGSDAVITDEDKEEIAALAYSLITLPNFEELVASEIPRHGEAIRDALELLQGDDRYKVEIADVQGLQAELDRLYQVRGATQAGGVSRNTVIDLIAQYGGGTGTGIVETIVAGTGISVDNTDPANPIVTSTASAPAWGDITGTLSDQTDLQTALNAKQEEAVVVSSSLTAALDQYYVNVATATYTDPTPTEGKGFIVFVRNGTATVGGTGYGTAGTIVHRVFHSGAWANYVYQVSSTFALASHTHTASQVTDFDTEVSNNTDVAANTAARHSAVTVADSAEIDFTLTGQQISASLVAGSIDETKLDASVNASLDLADSASQPGHTHTAANITDFDTEVSNNTDVAANTAARHSAVTVTDSTSIDLILTGQDISAQREALTGAITAPKNSNTTSLGSFTISQLNAAVSDADVSQVGHTHTLANVTDVTMTVANLNSLDDGVNSTLHFHNTDRDRANHTGSQLASTISDFAATVRATVLTGLSLATSTAVTAADSILVAIGKLQAQNTAQDAAIALNTAKVTNATHTGEVTGSGALTVDKTAITNKTLVSAAVGDHILVADASDTDNLKKVTVQTIVDLATASADTSFERLDFEVQTAPATPAADVMTVYLTGSGTSPTRTLEWKMKNEDGEEIILSTLVT